MTKKKTGTLSSGMINRGKRRSEVGFVLNKDPTGPSAARGRAPSERSTGSKAGGEPTGKTASEAISKSGGGSAVPAIKALNPAVAGQANVVPFQSTPKGQSEAGRSADPRRADQGRNLPREAAQELVQALRSADLHLAEQLFGDMTGLSSVEVLRVLYSPDGADLAIACRALGLEQLQFVSIFIMTRKLGLGEEALDPKDLARVVGLFEATDPGEASTALSSWQG